MRFFVFILIISLTIGCSLNVKKEQKIRYSGYSIPAEGRNIEIKLDSTSALNDLIAQLSDSTKLYETYKGYLIGFNDLMFSIAVHSDSAVEPLLDFIDTTTSIESRRAAILTLYLVGLNCKVEWYTYGEFTNIKARDALFKLLSKNNDLQKEVMILLIRDPQESDVPKIFDILETSTFDCWPITSGLLRYDLPEIPVRQTIPDDILALKVTYTSEDDYLRKEHISDLFKKFSKQYRNIIQIEDTLFNYPFEMKVSYGKEYNQVDLSFISNSCLRVGLGHLGANYDYQFKNDKVYFISAHTTKNKWVEWWKTLDSSYKESLRNSSKRIGINRI